MKLKEYISENKEVGDKSAVCDVIFQNILDNLDDCHMSFDDERIEVNVGNCIKKSQYNDLNIVIRMNDDKDMVRYARSKELNFVILIDTTKHIDNHKEVDSFISSNDIAVDFKKCLSYFIENDLNSDSETVYDNEREREVNDDESFDEMYRDIMDNVEKGMKKYQSIIQELQNVRKNYSQSVGKVNSSDLAIKKVKEDMFGKSENDFFNKFANDDSIKLLNADYSGKLKNRLSSYYQQKISSL